MKEKKSMNGFINQLRKNTGLLDDLPPMPKADPEIVARYQANFERDKEKLKQVQAVFKPYFDRMHEVVYMEFMDV